MGRGEQARQSNDCGEPADSSSNPVQQGIKEKVLLESLIAQAIVELKLTPFPRSTEIYSLTTLQYASERSDILWFLNIMRDWVTKLPTGNSANWCFEHAISEQNLWLIEQTVQRSYTKLQESPQQIIPKLRFQKNFKLSSSKVCKILIDSNKEALCVYRGHPDLGYQSLHSGENLMISGGTVLHTLFKKPAFIICLQSEAHEIISSVVLSDKEAESILDERYFCDTIDVINQNQVFPIYFNNVGYRMQKVIMQYWVEFDLKQNLLHICDGNDTVLECDNANAIVTVYALKRYTAEVTAAVESKIDQLRTYASKEKYGIPFPFPHSQEKYVLGEGLEIVEMLKKEETRTLAIKSLTAELDLSCQDVLIHFEGFHLESIQSSSRWEKECGITALAVFKSNNDAYNAFQNIATDMFLLEMYFKDPVSLVPKDIEISQRISYHIPSIPLPQGACKKAKGKQAKTSKLPEYPELGMAVKKVHDQVHRKLWKSVGDQFYLAMALQKDKQKHTLSCTVLFQDCRSARRGLDYLMEGKIMDHLVTGPFDREQLDTFTIKLSQPMHRVFRDVIIHKLKNLRDRYNLRYSEQKSGSDKYHSWTITTGNPGLVCEVMEKFKNMLAPAIHKFTPDERKFKESPYGQMLCEWVQMKTNCHFDYVDKKTVAIYGSKAAKTNGWSKFCSDFRKRQDDINQSLFIIDCKHVMHKDFTPMLHGKSNDSLLCNTIKHFYWCPTKEFLVAELQTDFVGCKDILGMEMEADDFFILDTASIAYNKADEKKQVIGECVSCFMELSIATGYITEGCGHLYCMECLKTQIKVTVKNNQFPVLCAADNLPFAYKDYTNLINLRQFKSTSILRAALRHFMANHSPSYKWCPWVNCEGIVECVKHYQSVLCTSCHRRTCTKCFSVYHPQISCEDLKNSSYLFTKWMESDTTLRKTCPQCFMGIEKEGGCNQVTCTHCKVSICWLCMEYFPKANLCYTHLQKSHGGYY